MIPDLHAELATTVMNCLDDGLGGELAALVGVDNLWSAVVSKRLLQNIDGMAGIQGEGDLGREDLAAGPVNHGCEIEVVPFFRQFGGKFKVGSCHG